MRIEPYTNTIDVEDYIRDYVNVEEFLEYCKECRSYDKKWSCPSFAFDPIDYWKKFEHLKVYGKKIFLKDDENVNMDNFEEYISKIKAEMMDELYEEEKKTPGSVALGAGSCAYCGEDNCQKKYNQPCKFPDKIRYSIEALGGNVGLTARKLLGINLLWCEENELPEYFVLVGGLLY